MRNKKKKERGIEKGREKEEEETGKKKGIESDITKSEHRDDVKSAPTIQYPYVNANEKSSSVDSSIDRSKLRFSNFNVENRSNISILELMESQIKSYTKLIEDKQMEIFKIQDAERIMHFAIIEDNSIKTITILNELLIKNEFSKLNRDSIPVLASIHLLGNDLSMCLGIELEEKIDKLAYQISLIIKLVLSTIKYLSDKTILDLIKELKISAYYQKNIIYNKPQFFNSEMEFSKAIKVKDRVIGSTLFQCGDGIFFVHRWKLL